VMLCSHAGRYSLEGGTHTVPAEEVTTDLWKNMVWVLLGVSRLSSCMVPWLQLPVGVCEGGYRLFFVLLMKLATRVLASS
jgi:hypothetical protein